MKGGTSTVKTKPKTKQKTDKTTNAIVRRRANSKWFFFTFNGKEYKLTPKQKKYAELYVDHPEKPAVWLIEKAGYTAKSSGSKRSQHSDNLSNPSITAYITYLLTESGLDEQQVDLELRAMVKQWKDLPTKARAVDIFYKLKGSYAPEKHAHIHYHLVEGLEKLDPVALQKYVETGELPEELERLRSIEAGESEGISGIPTTHTKV